jgi:hypothetical protein
MAKLIVKGGDLVWAGTPGRGGHIMFILQWLEGLRRLGHEVLYYDRADGSVESTRLFAATIERWWEPTLSAAVLPSGDAAYGLSAKEVERFGRNAAAVISLGCTFRTEPEPWLAKVHPRVLIELDPGFAHVWASSRSSTEIFGSHDIYFTVGANVGTPRCPLPTFGIEWRPIWNPVIIDWWDPKRPTTLDRFTTVAGWWNNAGHEFEGQIWGPKAEEFRKFVTLPKLVGEPLEIALEIDDGDPKDVNSEMTYLENHGWKVESPRLVVPDPVGYCDYLHASAGEFSCAKRLYVGTRCGWFSDRSECYLAAGRPVVVQVTGFADVLPTGEGLFSVSTVDEAAEAIYAITSRYEHHAAAARDLAIEHFDSRRVLPNLLKAIGL